MKTITNRRALATVTLIVLMAGSILGYMVYLSGDQTVSAQEAGRTALGERDSLIDSLTENSVLYQKFQLTRQLEGDYPNVVTQESWQQVDSDGNMSAEYTETRNQKGVLVATSRSTSEITVFTDLISGRSEEMSSLVGSDLTSWITHIWTLPQILGDGDYTSSGSGTLNGQSSSIYETTVRLPADEFGPARTFRKEVELVTDRPLLYRQSTYDQSGTLLNETTLLSYKVVQEMP